MTNQAFGTCRRAWLPRNSGEHTMHVRARFPAIAAIITACSVSASAQRTLPIGINLSTNSYYMGQNAFANLMMTASPWVTQNSDGSGAYDNGLIDQVACDTNGYPLQIPAPVAGRPTQRVSTQFGWKYPAGQYVCLYDGEGSFAFHQGARVVSSAPGRIVFTYDGTQQALNIERSVLGNHVRNIRILPISQESSFDPSNPFNPDFLFAMRSFQCIRYMGFMSINSSPVRRWEDRRKPGWYTQTDDVAIEHCITLSNLLGSDAWFCVPAEADSNFIRQYARLVRDRLDPRLTAYLEYSNEHWNFGPGFNQFNFIRWNEWAQNTFGVQYGWTAGENVYGKYAALTMRMFNMWLEEFGPAGRDRLVRVAASWHANWYFTENILAFLFDPGHGGCDALAVGGYIALSDEARSALNRNASSVTARQVLDSASACLERDELRWTLEHARLARRHGIDFLVYEGGSHIDARNEPIDAQIHEANRLPGIYDLYERNFDVHTSDSVQCRLFCALTTIAAPGLWGHLDSLAQAAMPPAQQPWKWRALMDFQSDWQPLAAVPSRAPLSAATVPGVSPRPVLLLESARALHTDAHLPRALFSLRGQQIQRSAWLQPGVTSPAPGVYVLTQRRSDGDYANRNAR
jgi:hypothetical protein